MNKDELQKYIKTLELKPGCKYIIFFNSRAIRVDEILELQSMDDFSTIIFFAVADNPNEAIKIIETE